MRIVLTRGPATPSGYLPAVFTFTFLAFIAISVFYFVFSLTGADRESGFAIFVYNMLSPITQPIFNWAGIGGMEPALSGMVSMFLALYLRAAYTILLMVGMKLQQLDVLDQAYGSLTKPQHRFWLVAAGLCFLGLFSLRYADIPALEDFSLLFYLCARAGLYLTLAIAGLSCVVIAMRLRRSWMSGKPAAPKPGRVAPRLKVAVDNTMPMRETGRPVILKPGSNSTDNGIYVAITAELIQACGRNNEAPTPEKLHEPILMLQKAAAMTRSSQFYHPDLMSLCTETCRLFTEGKIKSLPDLKTALKLYKSPDPSRLMDIAGELQAKLGPAAPSVH